MFIYNQIVEYRGPDEGQLIYGQHCRVTHVDDPSMPNRKALIVIVEPKRDRKGYATWAYLGQLSPAPINCNCDDCDEARAYIERNPSHLNALAYNAA
jgi:hypothetical protein